MENIISYGLFAFSFFVIFFSMIGYPICLKALKKIYKNKTNAKDYNLVPAVTVMVVAHNEEKVIEEKLNNLLSINYPREKIKFIVSSDNSTDNTNTIVKKFISKNDDMNIKLYEVKERKGKTNAQNEAQKTVDTKFLVMTDANSILDKNSVKELMASFTSDEIAYVSGKLIYINGDVTDISNAESSYWDSDLQMREIESKIQTITAGNGAIYACRNDEYFDFDPIKCHDSSMPLHYGLNGKRALYDKKAIAYEKAGEVMGDEFSRKVRMNRMILKSIFPSFKLLNIFKLKWFSFFYFGHRTCRYLLWLAHLLLLLSNVIIVIHLNDWISAINLVNFMFGIMLLGQISFYLLALLKKLLNLEGKIFNLSYYYTMTIIAQWVAVFKMITGKSKPFWEKAESTR